MKEKSTFVNWEKRGKRAQFDHRTQRIERWLRGGAAALVVAGLTALAPPCVSAQAPRTTVSNGGAPADSPPPAGAVTVPADSGMAPAMTIATRPDTGPAGAPAAGVPAAPHRMRTASIEKAAGAGADKPGGSESPFAGFGGATNHGPINIHSDTLNLDYKGNTVYFLGHVHATQSGSELTTDSLQVKYGKDFHEVQEMIANGNVRMSQGERWATGDHAVLEQAAHTVVLTGSPVVHDGNDQIAGTKITVHLDSGMSDVVDPKAVIFPRDTKSRDNGSAATDNTQSAGSAE
jgi:lipopolysaccharide transport protein LptA